MRKIPLEVKSDEAPELGADVDEADPVVEECLQDALGPYLGLLSAAEVTEHRRFLAAFVTTHPAARPLYERVLEGRRRRPANATSGPTVKDGAPVESEGNVAGNGTEGRR
jgi:hypothetical protein